MFDFGPIDDLLAPATPSSGRALASLARRRTFEQLKHVCASPPPLGAHAVDAVIALQAAFAARLPGDPHAIASAIANPAIGTLLRQGLDGGKGQSDATYLVLGIDRLLAELGEPRVGVDEHADATTGVTCTAVEGPCGLRIGDHVLNACVGVVEAPPSATLLRDLRVALAWLREASCAVRADVDRFATIWLVGTEPPGGLPASSIGIGVIQADADPLACFVAIVRAATRGKFSVLLGPEFESGATTDQFIRSATSVAVANCVHGALRLGRLDARSDAVRALAAFPAPEPEESLPSVVVPVLEEWRRLAQPTPAP